MDRPGHPNCTTGLPSRSAPSLTRSPLNACARRTCWPSTPACGAARSSACHGTTSTLRGRRLHVRQSLVTVNGHTQLTTPKTGKPRSFQLDEVVSQRLGHANVGITWGTPRPRAPRRRRARSHAIPGSRLQHSHMIYCQNTRSRGEATRPVQIPSRGAAADVCKMFANRLSSHRSLPHTRCRSEAMRPAFTASDLRFLQVPASPPGSRARARRGCCPGRPASSFRPATCAETPAPRAARQPAPTAPARRARSPV